MPCGPATAILGLAVILRAEISGLEIPIRRRLVSPTANGIHLAAQREAADLLALKPRHRPQVTEEDFTS